MGGVSPQKLIFPNPYYPHPPLYTISPFSSEKNQLKPYTTTWQVSLTQTLLSLFHGSRCLTRPLGVRQTPFTSRIVWRLFVRRHPRRLVSARGARRLVSARGARRLVSARGARSARAFTSVTSAKHAPSFAQPRLRRLVSVSCARPVVRSSSVTESLTTARCALPSRDTFLMHPPTMRTFLLSAWSSPRPRASMMATARTLARRGPRLGRLRRFSQCPSSCCRRTWSTTRPTPAASSDTNCVHNYLTNVPHKHPCCVIILHDFKFLWKINSTHRQSFMIF